MLLKSLRLFVLVLALSSCISANSKAKWNYHEQGENWKLGVCANNKGQQSPIDITDMEDTKYCVGGIESNGRAQ